MRGRLDAANTIMAISDCLRKKISSVNRNLHGNKDGKGSTDTKKRIGVAIGRALVGAIKKVAGLVASLINTQLEILRPIATLETAFAENFVIFPLNTAIQTLGDLDAKVTAPLIELGFDKKCPDLKKMHESIEATGRKTKSIKRKLTNWRDQAVRRTGKLSKTLDDMQSAVETAGELNKLEPPE